MREILFRGKDCKSEQGFVYGDLVTFLCEVDIGRVVYRICPRDIREDGLGWQIYPETLGQFTNMLAENRDKIFEGDIVEGDFMDDQVKVTGKVHLDGGCWEIDDQVLFNGKNLKILGNIHDNPELLPKEKENG